MLSFTRNPEKNSRAKMKYRIMTFYQMKQHGTDRFTRVFFQNNYLFFISDFGPVFLQSREVRFATGEPVRRVRAITTGIKLFN